MGFSDFVNKAKDLADQHDEQVDQGLDRAGDKAKKRFAGHESRSTASSTRPSSTRAPATPRPQGADPAAEVPAGPPTDVPAESGEVPPQ